VFAAPVARHRQTSAAQPASGGLAATAAILRRLLALIQGDLRGLRDRALLLVGFAGALRRSELAAIGLDHLEQTDRGIRLILPHSKGAQDSAVAVPLPYGDTELCPVHALEAWLQAAGLTEGTGFRRIWLPPRPKQGAPPGAPPPLPRVGATAITVQTVAQIVRARAVAAGFGLRDLGGYSLKRGALTTGMDRGILPAKLKWLGRHKSFDMLSEYLESGDLFEGHLLSGVL
jgi:integrase